VLGVKDAQELLALQASLFQPLAEKTAAYSRHLYDIASGTGAEFGKAFEGKTADAQKAVHRPWWTALQRTPPPAPKPLSP
jgi:phasin family protein